MKKLMMAVAGARIGASVFAEVPEPEVKFSFDDDLDAGLHVNEGTAGAVANLTDIYSTYGRGMGALYDLSSGRIGVYGYETSVKIVVGNWDVFEGVVSHPNAANVVEDLWPAATETWQRAEVEDVKKEPDGSVTLTVPAPADRDFLILKSKGVAK